MDAANTASPATGVRHASSPTRSHDSMAHLVLGSNIGTSLEEQFQDPVVPVASCQHDRRVALLRGTTRDNQLIHVSSVTAIWTTVQASALPALASIPRTLRP